ncbi:amylovoran biosynthesis protein AmsE [Chryseotalea sanaruensis]|uniref:Amylovoran biosynthesis protein AmsE n=2 Tax=Chryseotalea sanaruensis TaxID=2482724 RepID=A0A401UC68_9BACT|nr:amylovoran biosynthesis protein AmsE [Chryseotalea sanaruensis]
MEAPDFLRDSLDSLAKQKLPPTEIVLVKDGPLTKELDNVIDFFSRDNPNLLKTVSLEKNYGLGVALAKGLVECKNELVARMDADDISSPDRFEKQIAYLSDHPEIDVVGSSTEEFMNKPGDSSILKLVPEHPNEIYAAAKMRNPMNHMTVVFRKRRVIEAGNYTPMPYFEDYFLWVRMLLMGAKFYNIQTPLVMARVGNNMIGKRHGLKYATHEISYFRKIHQLKFITKIQFLKAIFLRIPTRFLPKGLLTYVYKVLLRRN